MEPTLNKLAVNTDRSIFALLECGQYSPNWPWTHLLFGQAAQTAVDLYARLLQPVHWAKFVAADHPWNMPVKTLVPAAEKLNMPLNVPRIGEPYTLGDPPKKIGLVGY